MNYFSNKVPQFCNYNSLLLKINKDNIDYYINYAVRKFEFEKVLKLPFYKNIKAYESLNQEFVNIMIFKIKINLNLIYNNIININSKYIKSFGIGYSTIKNLRYYNNINSKVFKYKNISTQNVIDVKENNDNNISQEFTIEIAYPNDLVHNDIEYECYLHLEFKIELKEEFINYLENIKDKNEQDIYDTDFYIDVLTHYKVKEYYPVVNNNLSLLNTPTYDLKLKEREYLYINFIIFMTIKL